MLTRTWRVLVMGAVAVGIVAAASPAEAVVSPSFPDGQIKVKTDGTFLGDNVYNTTASGQSANTTVLAGNTVKWTIRAQNDGSEPDKIRVIGSGVPPTSEHFGDFTVKYFRQGKNVTAKVRSGDFKTGRLDPGESENIEGRITGKATASSVAAFLVNLMFVSTKNGPFPIDVVRMGVDNT